MNLTKRFIISTFFAAVLGFCISSSAMAQGNTKGILVKIEDHWIRTNFGYKRIKVTVSLNPPRPASETMNFSIVARQMGNGFDIAIVTKPMVLAAGQKSVEGEIFVPQSSGQAYGCNTIIHVEEDGNLTYNPGRDLAMKYSIQNNYWGAAPGMPTLLVVSSSVQSNLATRFIKTKRRSMEIASDTLIIDEAKFPSIQELYDYYPDIQNQIGSVNNNPTAADVLLSASIHAIDPKDVPRSWLGLSSTEIILLSESDLIKVAKHSQQIQAIRKWIAAGGSLIVSDCGDSPARSFNQKAQNVRETIDGNKSNSAERKNPWIIPGKRIESLVNFVIHEDLGQSNVYYGQPVRVNQNATEKKSQNPARHDWTVVEAGADLDAIVGESGNQFAMFRFVLGRVTVVDDDMRSWNLRQWKVLLNSNMLESRTIRERFGEGSAGIPSTTFAISDVGQAPVNGFKVLIGLFVLLVGPVSYFVLKRQRRLQLLFAIVPGISLLACLGLMLFAVLSDGFQNRGRLRSFTSIDHSRQRAVSFSRHSHYQGIQPGNYNFGAEEAVFNSKAWSSPRTIYRQSENGNSFNGGDVRPRMPHQFVSVNSFETRQSLSLETGNEDDAPRVRNQFDSTIRLAVMTTQAGTFTVENLAPGATATGTPVELKNPMAFRSGVAEQVRELMDQISPNVRDEFLRLSAYSGSPYNYYYMNQFRNEDSKFETDFQLNLIQNRRLSEFIKQPGQYLAILEDYSEVTVPQDNIDYKNKIHVIHGKW